MGMMNMKTEKVYCSECKFVVEKDIDPEEFEVEYYCKCSENVEVRDTFLERATFMKRCRDLNAHNDCKNFKRS